MASYEKTSRSAELADLLQSVAQLLRQLLQEVAAQNRTTDARLGVLKAIAEAPHGACSQTELAQRLRQSESNISTLIERMRQDGLLYRLRCKDDRRKRLLRLSEDGTRLLQQIVPRLETRLDTALEPLDAEMRSQLIRGLAEVLQLLEQHLAAQSQSSPDHAARPAA